MTCKAVERVMGADLLNVNLGVHWSAERRKHQKSADRVLGYDLVDLEKKGLPLEKLLLHLRSFGFVDALFGK
ncbi:hypothetical protein D3C71_2058260 [compost metagenome]